MWRECGNSCRHAWSAGGESSTCVSLARHAQFRRIPSRRPSSRFSRPHRLRLKDDPGDGAREQGRWIVKRSSKVVLAGLLLTLVATRSAWAFGVKDVMAMHRDGVADSLIIQKIVY